jgi:hypothetical protein
MKKWKTLVCLLPDLSCVDVGDRGEVLDQILETRDFVLAEEHGWLP